MSFTYVFYLLKLYAQIEYSTEIILLVGFLESNLDQLENYNHAY